jgi:D-glycero-alpha-D-manno-heptose 1-phosphate guanylyltransferase
MRAIVLAGGFGTRLRGAVPDLPKPMAPIAGRPFLSWQLEYLARQGVSEVTLSVGYRAEVIEAHFGTSAAGVRISYVREPEPLGTGGGLRLALATQEGPEPVFVVNGDTLCELDYRALRHAQESDLGCPLRIVLREVAGAGRYSPVEVEGDRITRFAAAGRPGPALINAGVYLMDPHLLDDRAPGERFSLEVDFLEPEALARGARAWITRGFFIDIGVPEDYQRAQRQLPRFLSRQ